MSAAVSVRLLTPLENLDRGLIRRSAASSACNTAVIEGRLALRFVPGGRIVSVPRYFFHFSDGTRWFTDSTGQDLNGMRAARIYAIKHVRELRAALCDPQIQDLSGWTMTVVDAHSTPVFVLGFDLYPRPKGAMPDGAPRFTGPQPPPSWRDS
jgi:hypothetical protein